MRLRANLAYGTVTDAPLLIGATTLNSAELPRLATVVGSPDVMAVTLDPHRVNGEPEIVHVTAYDGSATSATIQRGQEGTTAREHPAGTEWAHSGTVLDTQAGTLLARTVYNPNPNVTLSTASITYVDADATNLAVTFLVPSSGAVDVILEGVGDMTATQAVVAQWALREGTSLVAGTGRGITRHTNAIRVRTRIALTGLTPAATLTYKWAYRHGGTSGDARLLIGTQSADIDWGPAIMEVWVA